MLAVFCCKCNPIHIELLSGWGSWEVLLLLGSLLGWGAHVGDLWDCLPVNT